MSYEEYRSQWYDCCYGCFWDCCCDDCCAVCFGNCCNDCCCGHCGIDACRLSSPRCETCMFFLARWFTKHPDNVFEPPMSQFDEAYTSSPPVARCVLLLALVPCRAVLITCLLVALSHEWSIAAIVLSCIAASLVAYGVAVFLFSTWRWCRGFRSTNTGEDGHKDCCC